jgi:hypothetical protein
MTALGGGGIIAMVLYCLRATAGIPLRYSEFEPWIFMFLTSLGTGGGYLAGNAWGGAWLEAAGTFGGFVLGYLLGIGAGLSVQRLGPLRAFIALAAGFALLVLVGTFFIYVFYIRK